MPAPPSSSPPGAVVQDLAPVAVATAAAPASGWGSACARCGAARRLRAHAHSLRDHAHALRAVALGLSVLALTPDADAAGPAPVAATSADGRGPDATRRAQRLLLERAKQRFEAGRGEGVEAREHLEGALDALNLAYRLAPEPWLLFNMAQVQSRLGACREGAELYRRFLASDPAPEARANAERALQLLGNCDSAEPEPNLADGLAPGLFLGAPEAAIFWAGGTAAARPLPTPPVEEASASSGVVAVLPWAFGSLAVMSGVAGLVYWNEAQSAKSDLDALRVAGPRVAETQQRGESAQDLAQIFGGCAIGFALAAGASYWWLRSSEHDERPADALGGLTWFPLQGGAGAAYRSAF